ncbi:serine/threonine protein phosphatase-like protein [Dermatophagoides farinae]|uniref:Serine/threonine-protein phosphatase n=1 Tax=Dermatophagoides farinae TaxID=6954 RepID=A0A9D4P491_DERFA|nr:serine/threonine protein phosphatase-like protein [Dermatophagoides farinae]
MESKENYGSKNKLISPPPKYIRSTPYRFRESSPNRIRSPPKSPTKRRKTSPLSPRQQQQQQSPPQRIITPIKVKRPSDKYSYLDDICCIALICNEHQRIGLLDIPQKGLFFPSLSCRMSNYSVNSVVREMLNPERIQIPVRNFLLRFIYRIDVSLSTTTNGNRSSNSGKNNKNVIGKRKTKVIDNQTNKMSSTSPNTTSGQQQKCICQMVQRTTIKWLSYDDICTKLSSTMTILESMNNTTGIGGGGGGSSSLLNIRTNTTTATTIINNNLLGPEPKYILEQQFGLLKKQQKNNTIISGRREEIISLYNEFLLQCYPSRYMTIISFKLFMEKILSTPLTNERIVQYFRSFDRQQLSYLNFNNLLLGLLIVGRPFACCPSSQSSKECCCPCRQLKYRLLFHYYSSSSKILDLNDMNKMIIDYKRKTKNFLPPRYSGEKIINGNPNNNNNNSSSNDNNESMPQNRQQLEERFRSQSQIPMELTFKQFYHHIQNGQLFRLLFGLDNNMNVEEYFDKIIRINIEIDDLILPLWRPLTSTSQWIALQSSTQSTLRCYSCKRTRYYLSTYFHTLSEIGEVTEVNRLDIENISPSAINGVGVMTTTTTAANAQNVARQFRQDMQENEIHVLANDLINRLTKIGSFLFDSSNDNEIVNVDQLTLLENWFYKEKIEMINNLKMICQKAEEIFALEPRLLNISSPCYIMGDIHGNLKDLLLYSQLLWKSTPFINQGRYLFLGDYVDRGQYGVECIIYLFCMKILAPQNFLILRGNHEIRDIQQQFSFYGECCTRFELELWDSINRAMDRLPITAIIDGRLFCAHGGIPITITTLEQIRSVPKRIENPLYSSFETWEILWNDPVSGGELAKIVEFEKDNYERGFVQNTRRGTAFQYTEWAVDRFCQRNQIEYIIRAHEVYHEGFHFDHRGKTMTIFSSSNYSELTNRSAVVFIDRERIRIVQVKNE